MIKESGMQQQYCLRWNNHKANLLTVFDELLRNEDFTDVTLACEGGLSIKCHKMVLAACSSYFQGLFSELPCRHPVVVLKDVRYAEIKAILEYMYKGEVSITQDEVEPLLKVAEALKVKGLVGENSYRNRNDQYISTSTNVTPKEEPRENLKPEEPPADDAHSTGMQQYPKVPFPYKQGSRIPLWPGMPMTPTHPSPMFNNCYEAAAVMAGTSTPNIPPLKRKKLSGLMISRTSSGANDTPILRTVLGQGQTQAAPPDSSQPLSLVCHSGGAEMHQEQISQSNGPMTPQDTSYLRTSRSDTLSEGAHSPYTELSSIADEENSQDRACRIITHTSSAQQIFYSESNGGVSSALANYVPTQRPEWKRYKQYSRNDIVCAIEAVRGGMSALQASRKFGVPSRTLYDKVKKMGITTSRPFKRANSTFPYLPVYQPDDESYESKIKLDEFKMEQDQVMQRVQEHSASSSPPSPIKYRSVTPSPPPSDYEDQVEDLSMTRKPEQQRVIMPPMSQAAAAAMMAACNDNRE